MVTPIRTLTNNGTAPVPSKSKLSKTIGRINEANIDNFDFKKVLKKADSEKCSLARQAITPTVFPAIAIINIISLLNDHDNINFTVDQLTKCRFYFKLVCLLCLIGGIEKATLVLAVILFKAKDSKQLALFVDFCCILSPFMPKLAHQLITNMCHLFDSIRNSTAEKTKVWTYNLLTLLEWETSANGNDCIFLNLSRAISENYHNFVVQIYACSFEASSKDDLGTLSYLLNILFKIGPPIRLSLTETYRIVTSCVRLLLVNISMTDMGNLFCMDNIQCT
uniref:Integrator complex subunit 5 C-terminal domain-containing protein n=1 Tax=Romanomermis culicivorax TaxID=13658 RepID=A0A915KTZ9_ROMCU